MTTLEEHLKRHVEGEVHFDSLHKKVYSVDASIYEVEPIGVVVPRNKDALVQAVKIAQQEQIAVIPRGAATGIAGGCVGKGLILDTSKYLNNILSIDIEQELVRCEPGVVQDQLNQRLAPFGYRLGPDTSTGNRATLGGMLANNASGAHSIYYGTMRDHVQSVELLLARGELLQVANLSLSDWKAKQLQHDFEGKIYQKLFQIRETYHSEISHHFPKIQKNSSGYYLEPLAAEPICAFPQLIAGSEGTLGIATEMQLQICRRPVATALCIVHVKKMEEGFSSLPEMLCHQPYALEMIDQYILDAAKRSPILKQKMSWLSGDPDAVFIAEFQGDSSELAVEKALQFSADMEAKRIGFAPTVLSNATLMSQVWEVRKAGLGLLLSQRSYTRAIAFLEDLSIPSPMLPAFMQQFRDYLASCGKQKVGIYGHVGVGCMHVRPFIDLRDSSDIQLVQQMMDEVTDLLLAHGGVLSGEHGDGLIRSWLNPKLYGEKLYQAFIDVKDAFDPDQRMNPGKIVRGPPVHQSWRLDAATPIHPISTFLDFKEEGGFELAVDLCNGNGQCRKAEKLMCPSFQVTGDEFDTTRARAQALRAVIHERLPQEELASHDLYGLLDLCIQCKGCKSECPSQVDMAKMKTEFLHNYQKAHGIPWRNFLFTYLGKANQIQALFPTLSNTVGKSWLSRTLLRKLGITSKRSLPSIANERFSSWVVRALPLLEDDKPSVILLSDTFTEFHQPQVGRAAFSTLQALGFQVIVPKWRCCGRPAFSKGLLVQAKQMAEQLIASLVPYAVQGIPIIGLEPSCIVMLKDEYASLLPDSAERKVVGSCALSFDAFLAMHLSKLYPLLGASKKERWIKVHGHCHQKAASGTANTLQILQALPGTHVEEIASGCCGMAGSFGYEAEHYDFSMKIGELHLFPAIRKSQPETLFVADGFSCRSQILHGTGRNAYHLAEVVEQNLQPKYPA